MPKSSNHAAAMANPTMHSFHPGAVGYLEHDEPLFMGQYPQNLAAPPAVAADGGLHALWEPSQAQALAFKWDAKGQCWWPVGGSGHRMAFTAAYLSSHGWTYKGPTGG